MAAGQILPEAQGVGEGPAPLEVLAGMYWPPTARAAPAMIRARPSSPYEVNQASATVARTPATVSATPRVVQRVRTLSGGGRTSPA